MDKALDNQLTVSFAARVSSACVALVTTIVLGLRVFVQVDQTTTVGMALVELSQFFTILSVLLVLGLVSLAALGLRVPASIAHAVVTAVIAAGVVYYIALAHLQDLSGLNLVADYGLHIVVPALAFAWWLLFAPKAPLRLRTVPILIAWPFVYCVYIQARAAVSGVYPYPFLDLTEIGLWGLARSIVILSLVFIVIGIVLSAAAWMFDRLKVARETA